MNKDKYNIRKTLRLQGYDYGTVGAYFITINVEYRIPYFGRVKNGIVGLSHTGSIVAAEWQKTAELRSNIFLGTWVIMPDHFHAIVYILPQDCSIYPTITIIKPECFPHELFPITGIFPHKQKLPQTKGYRRKFEAPKNDLSAAINSFKGACTRKIRSQYNPKFKWQSRFYDQIIRDQDHLDNVERYIQMNPEKLWRRMSHK